MIENFCVNVIVVIFVTASVTVSSPIPAENTQQSSTDKQHSLFSIPFLEFKNGGVRVNFGGYHAEAGLGGILGDSRTGGGLYAGAGTPFGAHASAGLGGNTNGENGGNTGGGLHARAGLGNGGPESAAGLGGNINGANPSGSDGRIYAARSNGGRTKIVFKDFGGEKISGIQHIPQNEKLVMMKDVTSTLKTETTNVNNKNTEMVRREISLPDEKLNAVEPIAPPVTDGSVNVYSTRRCRRKRLCNNNNVRKTIIYQQLPLSQTPVDFGIEKYLPTYAQSPVNIESSTSGILTDNTQYKDINVVPGPAPSPPRSYQKSRSTTLFDDIFNIPISTLTAVNQLLNNKAG